MAGRDKHWHLVSKSGQSGPFTEEEVSGMVNEGKVPSETCVWRAGWTDWRPIHEVFAPPIPDFGTSPHSNVPRNEQEKDKAPVYQQQLARNLELVESSTPTSGMSLSDKAASCGCIGCGVWFLLAMLGVFGSGKTERYKPPTAEEKRDAYQREIFYQAGQDLKKQSQN